jgi:hypothetical protein
MGKRQEGESATGDRRRVGIRTNPTAEEQARFTVRYMCAWFDCAAELSVSLDGLAAEIQARDLEYAKTGRMDDPRRLMGLSRGFYLLAGFATENYLKGLKVAARYPPGRDDSTDQSEAFLPAEFSSHRLTELAAPLGLSEEEREVLQVLERAVVWYARYPVPRRAEDFGFFGMPSKLVPAVLSLLGRLRDEATAVTPEMPDFPDKDE